MLPMENRRLVLSAFAAPNGVPFAKRVLDVTLSAAALLALWPLLLCIAAAVCLDDPSAGPLYVSARCGLDGRPFPMYKFRTMVAGAEGLQKALESRNEMDGPAFKIRRDPRVTRVGRFLRRKSLDELPQLFNVLRGDMSLVGPRPPLPSEVERYTERQRGRLSAVPGLTGPWQVRPDRYSLSFDDWVELDLQYIRSRSLRTDVILLLKTLAAVLKGRGV